MIKYYVLYFPCMNQIQPHQGAGMMENKEFPAIVKEWMEIIRSSAYTDTDRVIEYGTKLRTYAEDNGSDYLKGYCIFYLGINKYANTELDLAMEYLSEALKYLCSAEDWSMASHCYNSMGNIANFQGDISLAVDFYLKGLKMSRTYDAKRVEYNVLCNIANSHMVLNDHKSALNMLAAAETMVADGLDIPRNQRAVVLANLAVCHAQLDDMNAAADYLERLKDSMESTPSPMDEISICILETQIYNRIGNTAARDAAIDHLNHLSLRSMDVYDALNELSAHAKLLLDIGKIQEFMKLLDRIEALADSPTVRRHSIELRMKYYKMIGDTASYALKAVEYYDVAQQREEERNRIVSHNIITRIRLDEEELRRKEAEQSNIILKDRSEHDALTGLNNRYKLNELSEAAFQRTYLGQTPLTVEILDIDCYKEFNDNYGHQAGDTCLIKIAEAIRSMENYPRVHTGRYGGDEFVLVYEDYSKEEVEELAAILQQKIFDLNITHKHSKVCDRITISQGLFHSVPYAGNKLWDFMYSADMALYIIKKRGKNGFYVATNYNDVHDEYNNLACK